MPSCTFYAAPADFKPVLQLVFDELGCRVLEAYSDFDKELREFSHPDEVMDSVKPGGLPFACHLRLWPVEASDQVRIHRIELSPEARLGTFRYNVEGWGLISLQLSAVSSKGLPPSYTGHNSEKRAWRWADLYRERLGVPSDWKWDVVARVSAKLNRRLRALAITKLGSRPVLPGAKELLDSGTRAL